MYGPPEFWNWDALMVSKEPAHQARLNAISNTVLGIARNATLEPMTLMFDEYLGGTKLRYMLPNDPKLNVMSSKPSSWRLLFPFMKHLQEISMQGKTMHFMCVRLIEGNKKNLYPLFLVRTRPLRMTDRQFSAENAEMSKRGSVQYLEWCVKQNHEWLNIPEPVEVKPHPLSRLLKF